MNTGQRLIKNFFSLSGADVIARLLGSVLTIYIARVLGAGVFGQLSFAMAFTSYFALFSDFGLTTLGIREIAKDKTKTSSYATNILFLQVIISLILILILSIVLIFLPLTPRTKLITFIFSLGIIPNALNMAYIFQAYEKMEYIAIARIISQIGYVILGFLLVYLFKDILVLPIISFIAAFITALVIFYLLRKKIKFIWGKINYRELKKLVKLSWAFLVAALTIQIYYNIDSIMIQFMKGSESVGYYNAAYKIVLLLISLASFFQGVIYPSLSNYFKYNFKKAKKAIKYTSKFFIFIGLPIAAGGCILAPQIIQLFFGSRYDLSILPFRILIWSIFTIYTNVSFGVTLLASDNEKKYTISTGIGAILNLIFNLLLIPSYGLAGAAIATLISEVCVLLSLYIYAYKIIKVNILKNLIQAIFAVLIMSVILLLLKLNIFILILLGVIIYGIVLLTFNFINKEDLLFINSLIKKENN